MKHARDDLLEIFHRKPKDAHHRLLRKRAGRSDHPAPRSPSLLRRLDHLLVEPLPNTGSNSFQASFVRSANSALFTAVMINPLVLQVLHVLLVMAICISLS